MPYTYLDFAWDCVQAVGLGLTLGIVVAMVEVLCGWIVGRLEGTR